MRTRIFVAAVLALGMRGGVAVRADGNPSPIVGESQGGLARDDRSPDASRLTRDLRERDEPAQEETKRLERLEELDNARINAELLEMEVKVDKGQLQRMMEVLKETEFVEVHGFGRGPTLLDEDPDKTRSNVEKSRHKLAEVREDFVIKSKALARERRRVAELEGQLTIAAALPAPTPSGIGWNDAGRILDLVLKGVDTWRRASSRSQTPVDPKLRDADRLLDLIRKGVDTFQDSSSPSPSPSPKLSPTPTPTPTPTPSPAPSPADAPLKDAERVLELILKGVENWQRR